MATQPQALTIGIGAFGPNLISAAAEWSILQPELSQPAIRSHADGTSSVKVPA